MAGLFVTSDIQWPTYWPRVSSSFGLAGDSANTDEHNTTPKKVTAAVGLFMKTFLCVFGEFAVVQRSPFNWIVNSVLNSTGPNFEKQREHDARSVCAPADSNALSRQAFLVRKQAFTSDQDFLLF